MDLKQILEQYDHTMKTYYANRSKNTREQTWTSQMAEFIQNDQRPHMKTFLENKGFILR